MLTIVLMFIQIGPYSPSTLARSPLPPKLRAVNLVLDDEMYNSTTDLYVEPFPFLVLLLTDVLFFRDDVTYSYFQKQQNTYAQSAITSVSSTTPNSANSAGMSPITRSPITSEEDRRNERVVQGMRLLLAARERVLTLSEQRVSHPPLNFK